MSGSAWRALARELDAWSDAGRPATFWWRDDDAGDDAPAFARLLSLAEQHHIPLSVAAIPQAVTGAAAARLCGAPDVAALQHGYAHINHAPK